MTLTREQHIFDIGAEVINFALVMRYSKDPEMVKYGEDLNTLGKELRGWGDGSHVVEAIRKAFNEATSHENLKKMEG